MYGLDILIDERLHAWLLEVNLSPAFPSESEYTDISIKIVNNRVLGMIKIGLHYKMGTEEERNGDFTPFYRIYDESDANFTYYLNTTEYE